MESWESVLPDVLHASGSLLCTATNAKPHELLFGFHRKPPSGKTLPSWLLRSGSVFLKKHARSSKHDDVVEEVELLHANPMYANVRHKDGREQNLSLCDTAPCPRTQTLDAPDPVVDVPVAIDSPALNNEQQQNSGPTSSSLSPTIDANDNNSKLNDVANTEPRRSTRSTRGVPPDTYGQPVHF